MKKTKGALLTSVISLLLCFAMMLGTTFAWFTDSVSSDTNKIVAGNLDIELEYKKVVNGVPTEWDAVAGNSEIFDPNALWEPGRIEVVYLKVSNLGSLALKYQLGVNFEDVVIGKTESGADVQLSKHLVFKVIEMDDTFETYDTYEDAVAAAGTVKGISDYNGVTKSLEAKDEANDEDYLALIVYMPKEVGNEANYRGDKIPEIHLGIDLYATQYNLEADSFGTGYDAMAGLPWNGVDKQDPVADANGVLHVTNAAELVAMMDVSGNSIFSGKTIVLDADIDLAGHTVKGIGGDSNFAGVFDGQGHTVSNFKIDASHRSYYAGLFSQVSHGGTVKNLTVKGATVIGTSMAGAVASSVDSGAVVDNCKAINCTVIAVKKAGAVIGYCAGSTVTNNYAENCKVYYSEKEGAEVLGYENTGSTVSNNTFTNVSVIHAAYSELGEDTSVSGDFKSPNTIFDLGDNTLGLTGGASEISGNLTVKEGTVDTTSGYFDCRPTESETTVVFENVDFINNKLKKTTGSSTNHIEAALKTSPWIAGAEMTFIFKNCTFYNANVYFAAMSTYPDLKINATFENCTFDLFGNTSAIDLENYLDADITIKSCTFNLTATSSVGIVDASAADTVNVTFEGTNVLNGIAAVATDASLAGTVHQVSVNGPKVAVKAYSWSVDTIVGLETVTVTGIATK